MSIEVGVNLEFIRKEDKPFAAGVERAAQLGYRYVEPLVHDGRELLSEAGYYHSFSMDDDPGEMKDILDRYGVRASGLSAHNWRSPAMRSPPARRAHPGRRRRTCRGSHGCRLGAHPESRRPSRAARRSCCG